MTLGRLLMILVGIVLFLLSALLQQQMPVGLAVLCILVACLIGSYPNIVKLIRTRKEGLPAKNNPLVKSLIIDGIWALVFTTGIVFDWYRNN